MGPGPSRTEPASERDDRPFFVIARGHGDLLEALRAVLEDLGWPRLIEDRRREGLLLPREGREGKPYLIP